MKTITSFLFGCLSAALFIACGPQEPQKIAVTGITLDRDQITMTEGETTTLTPSITPADATEKGITWISSNQAIATVSEGQVNALQAGDAVITARTNDGAFTATCAVTVEVALAAVTGDASQISCRNANLAGKAILPASMPTEGVTFGILYSTESEVPVANAVRLEATKSDQDGSFTVSTEILEPETTYHYRSYVARNNEVLYGEVKSFKSLAVSSMIRTLEATDVDACVATLNAALDLTGCRYETLEYGFTIKPEGGTETVYKTDTSNAVPCFFERYTCLPNAF